MGDAKADVMRGDDFLIEHWGDEVRMEFRVLEVISWEDDRGGIAYQRSGSRSSPDRTRDRSVARVFASGHVTWDGCMNVDFPGPMPLHFCSRKRATAPGRLMDRLYDLALGHFPDRDGDRFD